MRQLVEIRHMPRNMWRTWGRMNFPTNGLVFYAPLWHPEFSGSPFLAWDLVTPGTHSCTVTGATWGSQGRTFDGTDDFISLGAGTFDALTNGTVLVWAKLTTDTGTVMLLWSAYKDGNNRFDIKVTNGTLIPGVEVYASGVFGGKSYGSAITLNVWYLYAFTFGSGGVTFSINAGTPVTTASTSGLDDIAATTFNGLGIQTANGLYEWKGLIGEAWIYNRALAAAEIKQSYLATKWRYS